MEDEIQKKNDEIVKLKKIIEELKEDNENLRNLADGKEDLTKDVEDQFIEKSKKYEEATAQIEKMENEKKQLMVDYQRLEKKMKGQEEDFLKDKKGIEAKFQKQTEMIKEKDKEILELKANIEKLEGTIKDFQPVLTEAETYRKKLEDSKTEMTSKEGILKHAEEEVQGLRFMLQQHKENYEREINSLKAIHAKEIEDLKEKYSKQIDNIKKASEIPSYYLKYVNKTFSRAFQKPEGIYMLLDERNGKWILDLTKESNNIEKRTAERQARAIITAGWNEGGKRLGVKYDLEIKE
ncbi:MAG: hypothetical protein EAX96_12480 [Candidatus Lokiarchaeota archaeon]|nr:hypothetical protein [Candidatus Lokiarchaeota archaeon]